MGALQPAHLIVVLVIVLLIFGPGKLPELGKAMGDGLRELKKATSAEDHRDTAVTITTPVGQLVPPPPVAPVASVSSVTPIGVAPSMSSRACPSCRGAVPVGDKFCGNCGSTIEQVTRSA